LKICLVVANDMTHDSRVDRHADTLGANGHDVTVLCVQTLRTKREETKAHYSIIRRKDLLRRLIEARMHIRATQDSTAYRAAEEATNVSLPRSMIRKFFRLALAVVFDVTMALEAKRLNADLYICNDLDTLPVGAFMSLLGRKVVYDAHELYPDLFGETQPYVRALMRRMESFLMRFTDLVITVNEFIASELSSRYGIPPPTVVMNCPGSLLEKPEARSERREKTVLYHGGLTRERGLENIVLACKHLRENVRIVFRGEGPIEARLKELARGLQNCVFEKPVPVNEVISKAAEADVGIVAYLPTTLNNLYASPNKLFEYLQAGLPVVGSNIPFIRQILVENEVGLVFDPYDPIDIAGAIDLITREEIHEKMKRNVEKARGQFSWEVESRKFLHAIYGLLSRESRR